MVIRTRVFLSKVRALTRRRGLAPTPQTTISETKTGRISKFVIAFYLVPAKARDTSNHRSSRRQRFLVSFLPKPRQVRISLRPALNSHTAERLTWSKPGRRSSSALGNLLFIFY